MGTQLVEGKQKVLWQSTCMLSGLDLLDTLAGCLCRTSCSRDQRSCWQEFAGNTMTQYDTDGESNIFHLLILFSLLFLHRLMLALYNNVWLDIIGLTVAYHVVVLHP